MREAKFTPGPWDRDERDFSIYQLETSEQITEAMDVVKNGDANSLLIAAAPEIYEALSLCAKSILEDLQLTGYDEDEALEHPALEAAFAALSKARGEESK